jgi:LacI family transcriptional regulator
MKKLKTGRVALLFNGRKHLDRQIIAGIASHLAEAVVEWEVFIEEDFQMRLAGIERLHADGIIANFDDPVAAAALARSPAPVVAVGGSYGDPQAYPAGMPYVASDDVELVQMAIDHLHGQGLRHLALFGSHACAGKRWAREREQAFRSILARDGKAAHVFQETGEDFAWDAGVGQLSSWMGQLPRPIGIVAATDACARRLLRACLEMGIRIPEQVALVALEDEPLTRGLTPIGVSSVIQDAHEMGRVAAHMLNTILRGAAPAGRVIVVPPTAVHVAASSQHRLAALRTLPAVLRPAVLAAPAVDQRTMLGRLES